MKSLILIVAVGMLFPRISHARIQYRDVQYTRQNQSDVSAERREPYTAAMLTVGKVLVSAWMSIQKDTSIKIQITNKVNRGELNAPQWFTKHGHASVLPPPAIALGQEVTEIQFDKTVGGGEGTEGVLVYAIEQLAKAYLVIMWRVPQFGVFENIAFHTTIARNIAEINKNYLESLFNGVVWRQVSNEHKYYSIKDGYFTLYAAMGTQNTGTLRVTLTSI